MFRYREKPTELWQKNLMILWFGVFMMGIGFSEVMPFLSLYVDTLGHFSTNELNFYSAVIFSISFLTTAFTAPFWGRLADEKGRKLMLLRASLGMAIIFILMGLATSVWQLIVLRAIQGVLGGFISNATAFVATQTPKEHSGYAMGVIVTGMTAGQLLGPFIGGTLASIAGFRMTFFVTGFIFFLVFLLILWGINEHFVPTTRENAPSLKEVIQQLPHARLTLGLFITTMMIQIVNLSITPIISLFVRQLNNTPLSVTFLAGIVAAMPGLATLIAAPRFGALGDRVGTERMVMVGFLITILALVPTAFVTSVWQLAFFRFFMGIGDSTMLPAVQTLLSKTTPKKITSRIFAYNQSFQAIGSVTGPMFGTVIALYFGYQGIFIGSAILVLITAIFFRSITRNVDLSAAN